MTASVSRATPAGMTTPTGAPFGTTTRHRPALRKRAVPRQRFGVILTRRTSNPFRAMLGSGRLVSPVMVATTRKMSLPGATAISRRS
jgi:hypothetical protein